MSIFLEKKKKRWSIPPQAWKHCKYRNNKSNVIHQPFENYIDFVSELLMQTNSSSDLFPLYVFLDNSMFHRTCSRDLITICYPAHLYNIHLYTAASRCTHLFIKQDVDDWVVHSRGLWEHCRYGGKSQVKSLPAVVDHPKSEGGVRQPADQESHHHDHNHPGHLPLSLLGGGGLGLSFCCLAKEGRTTCSELAFMCSW